MKHFWILLFLASNVKAAWTGKFNTDLSVLPCAGYSFIAKEADSGLCKPLWHLDENGIERVHIGYSQMWNVNHGNPAYMGTLGLRSGNIGTYVDFINDNIIGLPSWAVNLKDIGTYVSIEGMGGYRTVGHFWDVMIGGYLNIPLGPR